jgi:hypothetical protein
MATYMVRASCDRVPYGYEQYLAQTLQSRVFVKNCRCTGSGYLDIWLESPSLDDNWLLSVIDSFLEENGSTLLEMFIGKLVSDSVSRVVNSCLCGAVGASSGRTPSERLLLCLLGSMAGAILSEMFANKRLVPVAQYSRDSLGFMRARA